MLAIALAAPTPHVMLESMGGLIMLYVFEFLYTRRNGDRVLVDSVARDVNSAAHARMLAASMVKHARSPGQSADVVVIKDKKGKVACEVAVGVASRL